MAELNQEKRVDGVFGGVSIGEENAEQPISTIVQEENANNVNINVNPQATPTENVFKKVETENLPANPTIWTKLKAVLFTEIRVELTPYQQKIEKEINDFLHQEITLKGFFNLFKSKKK